MIVQVETPFGTYRVVDPHVISSAISGTQLEGWFALDGELWPQDFGPIPLDSAIEWEFLG